MFEVNYQMILPTSIAILIGGFTYYTLKIYYVIQKYKHIPGPPTDGILGFYLGNLTEINANRKNDKIIMQKVAEW